MSESHHITQCEAPGSREEALLSPRRAFVVQFRTETEAAQGGFVGRVEHMVSGQAAHFRSPEELVAFIRRILADIHEQKEVIP